MKSLLKLVLVVGIGGTLSSAQSNSVSTQQPFSINISAAKTAVKLGLPVLVKVRMTNMMERDINLGAHGRAHGEVDPEFKYDCRDETGRATSKDYPIMLTTGDHAMIILKSGESYEEEINVGTACDLSTPGKYEIRLSREGLENSKDEVKSNKVTITVMP
jgi:hypothetical protein